MDPCKKRLPFLNLQNQYTYIKGDIKKKVNNALFDFANQLNQMNKLPPITKKQPVKTTRRIQKQLHEVQQLLSQHQKRRNLLSQYRNAKPKVQPIYMPLSINIPNISNMQMPMCPRQMQSCCNSSPKRQENLNSNQNNNTNLPVTQTPKIIPQNPSNLNTNKQNNQSQSTPTQKNQLKKPKQIYKFPQKSKINKFRVAAYAVYFSLYIKYFSKKFTELRRNWFNERYAINEGRIIYEGSAKILKHLYQIDIYKMLTTARQRVKQIDLDDGKISNSKTPDSVLTLIHFVSLIMDYAKQYMTSSSFILQHHQVFTVGVLTQNFMLNNLYLPQQAAILHIHNEGYILIQQQTQIILLMLKIILKIIVYNFLLSLKYSRNWNAKQQKSHGLDDSQMNQIWTMTRNAGIFLCIVCEEVYDKTYKQMSNSIYKYNFHEISPKYNILSAKSLQEPKRTNSAINQLDQNSKLIKNLQGYSDMQALISSFSPLKKFKDKIKLKMIDFLTMVYTSLKYQEAKVYDFIRYLTLDQKYLIMKGVKQDLINKKNKKKNKKKKKNSQKNSKNGKRGSKKGKNQNKGQGDNDQQANSDDNNQKQNQNQKYNDKNQNNGGGNNSDSEDQSQNDSDQDIGGKKKKKKLRFKHQQLFFDHKFDGHSKLLKLKHKMHKKP